MVVIAVLVSVVVVMLIVVLVLMQMSISRSMVMRVYVPRSARTRVRRLGPFCTRAARPLPLLLRWHREGPTVSETRRVARAAETSIVRLPDDGLSRASRVHE
jgi:hypothetical protein